MIGKIKGNVIHSIIIIIILMFVSGCSGTRSLENKEKEKSWRIVQEIDEVGTIINYMYDKNGKLYLKRKNGCDTFYVYKGNNEEYHYDVDTYKKGEGFICPTWSINVYSGENENDKINEIKKLVGEGAFWSYLEVYYYDENNRIIKEKKSDGETVECYEYSAFNNEGDYTKCKYTVEKYEDGSLVTTNETKNIVEYKYKDGKEIESVEKNVDENGVETTIKIEKKIYDTENRKIENKTELYYGMETIQGEQFIYYDYDNYGNVIKEINISKFSEDEKENLGIRKYKYEEIK